MNKSGSILVNQDENVEGERDKILEEKREEEKLTNQLHDLVEDENQILYEVSSVFPFQLFPDRVLIYPTKIVVVHRWLFFKHVFPMLIRDINTVTISRGLLFSALRFEIRSFEQNPNLITHLWPEHAGKAESIILGLLSAIRDRGIDVSKVPAHKARRVVRKLGETDTNVENIF